MTEEKQSVLVVGQGGREFAIAKKLTESRHVATVYCAPGNVGMPAIGVTPVAIEEDDFAGLVDFAREKRVAWTFVGPETALVDGIVDHFQAAGLKIFGPTARAAQLEGSKDYALNFMQQAGVPTARHATYQDLDQALAGLDQWGFPVVLKADGLAGGKGVVIAPDPETAERETRQLLAKAGARLVVEEYMEGPEYSLFVLVENGDYQLLPMAQDHKRALDGDKGKNTGGMGAYSPLPQLSLAAREQLVAAVVAPTVAGLVKADYHYHGILYIGVMVTASGPKVIEYNVRLGDPETQVILPRIATDLFELVDACLDDRPLPAVAERNEAVLGVVLASAGYPAHPVTGQSLGTFPPAPGITIDYANVAGSLDYLRGAGGRLLMVIATAADLATAQRQAYAYLAANPKEETYYRHDIGARALN